MTVRPLTIVALAAVVLGGAGASGALAVGQPVQRITATLEACHPSAGLAGRYAVFAAQMRTVAATDQMSIRFELDERTPAAPGFHARSGVPGFGVWKSSAPRVDIFGFSQEVSSLASPAAFRVTVAYRWLGARHRVIKRARRVTPVCSLPAPSGSPVPGSPVRVPPVSPQAGAVVGGLCTLPPAGGAAGATPGGAGTAVCR